MKNQMVRWIGSAALLAGFAMLFTQCEKTEQVTPLTEEGTMITERGVVATPGDVCSCLDANFDAESLSDEEIAALTLMREEEKLARDVYQSLYEKWDVQVFSNIARAEQRHMDAVLCLIERYGLADPVGDNGLGEFQNTALQGLHENLLGQGVESLEAALAVGATIEDLDILDLMQNIEDPEIDNKDVLAVFNNLMKGSRNHLRAFTRTLEKLDITYEVQYISQDDYEAIISTSLERGEGLCGAGNGNGTGTCDGNGPNGSNGNGSQNGNNSGNGPNNSGGNGTGTCDGTGPYGGNGPGNGNNNGNGNGGGK